MAVPLSAQKGFTIEGTVYDSYNKKPVEAVVVLKTNGYGTITDSTGKYRIHVNDGDSIWFSFLGKNTMKYAVDTITNVGGFDVALMLDIRYLPEVKVRSSNYKLDSLRNREDYAKIFNFRKPGLSITPSQTYTPGGLTVGLDLEEFINMFRFKRNKRLLSLQERLIQQEQDKYIFHRFSKRFVRQLTNLSGTELDNFMQFYKPDYEMLKQLNDVEVGYYIQQCFLHYQKIRKTKPIPEKDLSE